jgi:prepilin-type N-terminal cleavage/methylation domain-containing protein
MNEKAVATHRILKMSIGQVHPRSDEQDGYTLLEVMLVLVLLLVLGGLAYSRLEGIHERYLLREAAEALRSRANEGRLRAADTGMIYQFSFENGGRSYSLAPFGQSSANNSPAINLAGELPASMHFQPIGGLGSESSTNAGAATPVVAWCEPLLFFPDGTSSGGSFEVVDSQGSTIRLTVRALTAVCSIETPQRNTSP